MYLQMTQKVPLEPDRTGDKEKLVRVTKVCKVLQCWENMVSVSILLYLLTF